MSDLKSEWPRYTAFGPSLLQPLTLAADDARLVVKFADGTGLTARQLYVRQRQVAFVKKSPDFASLSLARVNIPPAPLCYQKCSKRSFQGQIAVWRQRIYRLAHPPAPPPPPSNGAGKSAWASGVPRPLAPTERDDDAEETTTAAPVPFSLFSFQLVR